MYQCKMCGKSVLPGTKCKKIVTSTRVKEYPPRRNCNRPIWEMDQGRWKKRLKSSDDPGGVGVETAVELPACPNCAAEYERKLSSATLEVA